MDKLENQVRSAGNGQRDERASRADVSSPADPASAASLGLPVAAVFCSEDVESPFDTVEWETRSAAIKGENGEVVFEQKDCEIPAAWSQLAANVVVSKYFFGEVGTPQRETSVRQLIHRVTRTIADWGKRDGYFASEEDGERFYRELTWLCLHQYAAFNSPVWFNVGLYHQYGIKGDMCNWHWDEKAGEAIQPENPYEYPQGSACFIQSVADNMEDIMELARSEAMLFKFGSGTGTDLSTLRSQREKLSGGGRPSGPLSFMRVYDQIAAVVKSGGKTRRAAKMQSLKVWHPDILEFIECKQREEEKARILLAKGYNYEDAYSSVLFQNANLSIRVSDEFMAAAEAGQPWTTRWVTDPAVEGPTYAAKDLLEKMAKAAWACGDPGMQYDSTINRWHTCPNSGRINGSNPCSEYMFVDDSACNLASINLMRFRRPDGTFDVERFEAACRLVLIAQEILVDHASYPTQRIAANSHRFRPLGLGYSNLGALLMSNGLPYDSDQARGVCGAITALMHGTANRTSAELAAAVGSFEAFDDNREAMLRVMEMHWEKVEQIQACPAYMKAAARKVWDEVLAGGRRYGFRNAQVTVLAPTGTISFMMDCCTTGIEPDIALVKYKQLVGGGTLKIINRTVPLALESLGYEPDEVASICDYVEQKGTIEGPSGLRPEHLPVFDCAFLPPGGTRSIPWRAHVRMMAAAQPFISGAISKTVNMPKDSTVEDIASAYVEGWRLGLKALAVYRDGSKGVQPLSTRSGSDKADQAENKPLVAAPRRERLPDTRTSITHKFSVAGHEGYITVGLYPDGRPGEMFITMAKEGSTIGGLMDCFGTAVSMSLQYGVPLEVYVQKFSHTRFEPMGPTKNPDIRIAKSIVDYIFRWLGVTFIPGFREANKGLPYGDSPRSEPGEAEPETESMPAATTAGGPKPRQGVGPNGGQPLSANGSNGKTEGGSGNGHARAAALVAPSAAEAATTLLNRLATRTAAGPARTPSEQFALFQEDAPSCDNCGAITVRTGNCYLCHNCGASMGCS
ncbi:MAG: vitamin B12-dependent ribonucleotide reductase [Pirellulales bacterium]|jgi:ribonucleoside-diphosphate reductase alpha chain|nr:vitamin B12-dependent ribonucleotide reductase [Thermoguttaceae bacterium]MDD4787650.1 vitamin B12-dependent ribonucleotide reductase [Pirellulales bacterium]NLZ01084.1 vitamin B12-dependent ribonucleotide reductase [Pirellulaceae bacterium]